MKRPTLLIERNGQTRIIEGPPEHAFLPGYHCMVCHCDECRTELLSLGGVWFCKKTHASIGALILYPAETKPI